MVELFELFNAFIPTELIWFEAFELVDEDLNWFVPSDGGDDVVVFSIDAFLDDCLLFELVLFSFFLLFCWLCADLFVEDGDDLFVVSCVCNGSNV